MADTAHEPNISPGSRTALVRLLRVAYPHPQFPDGPYERTADEIVSQVDESLWHRLTLTQGNSPTQEAADAMVENGWRPMLDVLKQIVEESA